MPTRVVSGTHFTESWVEANKHKEMNTELSGASFGFLSLVSSANVLLASVTTPHIVCSED
jgi:hypothetical protein